MTRREHRRQDWDALAASFDADVCHVLEEDRGGVLARALEAHAAALRDRRQSVVAVDFGCGTGRALPLLARLADRVVGTDISPACLEVARARCQSLANVTVAAANLAARPSLPRADLALCVNVAIMPDDRVRNRILGCVARHLRAGARLLLVVPALESNILVRRRWRQWTGRHRRLRRGERIDLGLVEAGGWISRHWTGDELYLLAATLGCRPIELSRIEFGWDTEFEAPPRSMAAPWPWDWLAVLERGQAAS